MVETSHQIYFCIKQCKVYHKLHKTHTEKIQGSCNGSTKSDGINCNPGAISHCSPRLSWAWSVTGKPPGKTRLLLEEVLARPAGGAHPVLCMSTKFPV